MREQAVPYLCCAHCGASLSRQDRALVCPTGHAFDIARQGYVNLLPRPARHSADTAEMVADRAAFLAEGHYAPVADALSRLARSAMEETPPAGCIADIGGGTGYYHAAVVDTFPDREGILLDLSKYAARRAARSHPRISAAVTDAWQGLPLRTGAAALVLSVFAPRNPSELRRVLHGSGALLIVAPRPEHLQELRDATGLLGMETAKDERLAERLAPYFSMAGSEELTRTLTLGRDAVAALVGMGPTAHHRSAAETEEAAGALPHRTDVTLAVTLTACRPLSADQKPINH